MYPRIAVGDHDISVEGDGEENFHVQSWVSHPQYNLATTDYDYAIITLSKPIQFSDSAMYICEVAEAQNRKSNHSAWLTVIGKKLKPLCLAHCYR